MTEQDDNTITIQVSIFTRELKLYNTMRKLVGDKELMEFLGIQCEAIHIPLPYEINRPDLGKLHGGKFEARICTLSNLYLAEGGYAWEGNIEIGSDRIPMTGKLWDDGIGYLVKLGMYGKTGHIGLTWPQLTGNYVIEKVQKYLEARNSGQTKDLAELQQRQQHLEQMIREGTSLSEKYRR